MEIRKVWFPLLVAAVWVVMCAITLSGFASFSGTARAQQQTAGAAAPVTPLAAAPAQGAPRG